MKTIELKSAMMTYQDASKYIFEIFGQDAVIEFDDKCIGNLNVCFCSGDIKLFLAEYNKVAAKLSDGKIIYWPIQTHHTELSIEEGRALLKEKI